MPRKAGDRGFNCVQIRQIRKPDGAAPDLVLVGRSDSAPRGADFASACCVFPQRVELLVERKDQRDVFGDGELFRTDPQSPRLQPGDFLKQRPGIQHGTAADDGKLAGPDDARRQHGQLVGFAADNQRVACVVAALEADDGIEAPGKPIDDLAFALVAPLDADHDRVRHSRGLPDCRADPRDPRMAALSAGGCRAGD